MKIIYRAYDNDLHRFMKPSEVRIDCSGQVWYNNSTNPVMEFWEPLADTAKWLTIESVIVKDEDGHTDNKKRVR